MIKQKGSVLYKRKIIAFAAAAILQFKVMQLPVDFDDLQKRIYIFVGYNQQYRPLWDGRDGINKIDKGSVLMKIKKKIIALAAAAVFGFSTIQTYVSADSSALALQVDDKPFVAGGDVAAPYINRDGRTLVPLRFISENMGASVSWNGENNQAMIQKGDITIYVTVGLNQIVVNGSNVDMDTSAENTDGSVFVPARYIAEALGAEVNFNPKENKVYILSDTTNNFIAFGLKPKVQFPFTIESRGLKVTVNNIHVYPVDSPEAQEHIKEYKLGSSNPGTQHYFMWANVTLENVSDDDIGYPSKDWIKKWEFMVSGSNRLHAEPGIKSIHDTVNSTEYLWAWNLKAGEELTTNVGAFSNHEKLTYVLLQGYEKDNIDSLYPLATID
ncbi:copper amine oxidase N-terminal domain-containing protein [Neobacillus pocheonensis]|uniref:copper amine oxidase N-terminal domain-containing protein n=1 Tax=Neobacillus pocheonensis TaxID=363869 RepID=UPI003D2E6C5A